MNIQLKQQLKSTLLTQVDGLMRQYNISASDMESALESTLLSIKDVVLQDYINENVAKQQQENEKEDNKE